MKLRSLALVLVLVCIGHAPALAQDAAFITFPDTPAVNESLQTYVYDESEPNPLFRDRRQTISVMLSGVRSEIATALTASEVVAGAGIDIDRTGGVLTFAATGPTTFIGLTDVAATSIVDGECIAGVSGSLGFQACGGTDTDTHVEFRDGGQLIRTNPSFVNFTGSRALLSTTGTTGVIVNIIGPLIYDEGMLLVADPTVLDFTGAGVTTTVNTVSGLVTIDIPGGGGGMADGVATAGAYDSTDEEIDFTVTTPGANFSVDVSALVGGGGQTLHRGANQWAGNFRQRDHVEAGRASSIRHDRASGTVG